MSKTFWMVVAIVSSVLVVTLAGTLLAVLVVADSPKSTTTVKTVTVTDDTELKKTQAQLAATEQKLASAEATGIKGRQCVIAVNEAALDAIDGDRGSATQQLFASHDSCQEFSTEVKQFESYKE